MRRMGRPGLLGTMARTAVITGTAQATSNAMNRRAAARQQQAAQQQAAQQAAFESQAQLAAMQQQAPAAQPPAPVAAAPVGGPDLMAQLQQLADLKASGMLSDQEFAQAKAKLLGS